MILVTGGAGYIGSHTVVELSHYGDNVVIVDNFSNSNRQVLARINSLCRQRPPLFYEANVNDKAVMGEIFKRHNFHAVVHFAAFKAVGESVSEPYRYYYNNISSLLSLLSLMQEHQVWQLVFSSSAAVYGNPHTTPITEDFPLQPTSPYGWTKLMCEQILRDLAAADERWLFAILRYFNPIGAHESGLIGENPTGTPNNLMPYITQVASGKLEFLKVFGDDYPTPDGTGVRDYIHVADLANGHRKALEYLSQKPSEKLITVNLGTGSGFSVLDVVKAFEQVTGCHIPYRIYPRRLGDVAQCFASVREARILLNWRTKYDLNKMCQDSWNWQQSYSKWD